MIRFTPLLAACAVVVGVLATAQDSSATVGDIQAYSFRESPLNAMGISGLEDLRGTPVLVEFWGTR